MKKIICFIMSLICIAAFASGCSEKNALPERDYNINLSHTDVTLEVGESKKLIATYGEGFEIVFNSSNESVATVSSDGTVSAVAEGTAYIEVSVDEKSKICKVTVVKNDYEIRFDCSDITLIKTAKKAIKATVYKNGEKTNLKVEWSVNSTKCGFTAEDNQATFEAKESGVYEIIAKYKNAETKCVFTVVTAEEANA